jgi:hypothetical protein
VDASAPGGARELPAGRALAFTIPTECLTEAAKETARCRLLESSG